VSQALRLGKGDEDGAPTRVSFEFAFSVLAFLPCLEPGTHNWGFSQLRSRYAKKSPLFGDIFHLIKIATR